jgi:hypothetical protein
MGQVFYHCAMTTDQDNKGLLNFFLFVTFLDICHIFCGQVVATDSTLVGSYTYPQILDQGVGN